VKKALITGITGQDGSYLSELLLSKGYEVHGLVRRTSSANTGRLFRVLGEPGSDAREAVKLWYGDMSDGGSLTRVLNEVWPDEIYNLAAQSDVGASFEIPEYTADIVGVGTLRLLESIQLVGLKARVCQASSSEIFGKAQEVPQRETTPFHPRSPYACAKAFAHCVTVNYRESRGLFACNAILFNHESPRRGECFVTRKVTRAVARIKHGSKEQLRLGNLEARRDWGHAREYVEAMWRILQAPEPDDYVVATGETHSVRELCEEAFAVAGLEWEKHVQVDPRLLRPADVEWLQGDSSKLQKSLGWIPKTRFRELVREMVEADLEAVEREKRIGERSS
jgi:GDPmannose 4,6-dehydratase